jgi:tetratricopeptide (TPR) repeat protein
VFKIRSLLGDERGLQSIRNNIAIIYRQRGMLDSALFFFNQNYDYAWSHGIKDAEALALHNAASVYMDDGQWDKAVQGFKKCFEH